MALGSPEICFGTVLYDFTEGEGISGLFPREVFKREIGEILYLGGA
jgi:hypothetical protein